MQKPVREDQKREGAITTPSKFPTPCFQPLIACPRKQAKQAANHATRPRFLQMELPCIRAIVTRTSSSCHVYTKYPRPHIPLETRPSFFPSRTKLVHSFHTPLARLILRLIHPLVPSVQTGLEKEEIKFQEWINLH